MGRARLLSLVDVNSFVERGGEWRAVEVNFIGAHTYAGTLELARRRSGETESVVTGLAELGGHRIAVAAFDFSFMGGTLGIATTQRLVALIDDATDKSLPLITINTSGGVRVQEGVPALVGMAVLAAAARRHRDAGNLQVAILADPCFGGVAAGFALAADILIADPGARVGFAGVRVAEEIGRSPSDNAHLMAGGPAYSVVDPRDQRAWLRKLLNVVCGHPQTAPGRSDRRQDDRSKRFSCSSVAVLAQLGLERVVVLEGKFRGCVTPALSIGLGRQEGIPFAWLALGDPISGARPDPASYAKARQHLRLAERLRLPVVCAIDTLGADSSSESERRDIGGEIAATMAAFVSLRVPTCAVVVGTAGSGGAMALAFADRLLMVDDGTFYVLPPRAIAALLLGDADRADELAPFLDLDAKSLVRAGVVDAALPTSDRPAIRAEVTRFLREPPRRTSRHERWDRCVRSVLAQTTN